MARDFHINGETLVRVLGMPGTSINNNGLPVDLGLASEGITITPHYYYKDVIVNDFGPDVPAEVLVNLADCEIEMNLIHFDYGILRRCLIESLGGGGVGNDGNFGVGAGFPLGGGVPLYTTGNHYIAVYLTSPVEGLPWRFPSAYLTEPPMMLPLGTEKSIATLNWRAIPYTFPFQPGGLRTSGTPAPPANEITSLGAIVWDHVSG